MRSTVPFRIQASAAGNIARLAYAAARRKGADVDRLLMRAGLSREQMDNPDARIGVKGQIKFLNLVAGAINDDLLGFHLALHFDLRMVGLPYYVFASSETLDDAIRNGARCASVVNESVKIEVRDGRRRVGFVFEPVGVARYSDRHQIEFWVAAVMRACRSITRRHLTAETVTFAHSRKSTPELNRFFGNRVAFGADADVMTFSAAVKDIVVVTADRYLNNLLVHYCEEALWAKEPRLIRHKCRERARRPLASWQCTDERSRPQTWPEHENACPAIGVGGFSICRCTAPSPHCSCAALFGRQGSHHFANLLAAGLPIRQRIYQCL